MVIEFFHNLKRTTPRRIQIFKKLADIRDLGGFQGEESNKKTRF